MSNLENNKKIIDAMTCVTGNKQTELIEKLASEFSLARCRQYHAIMQRISEKQDPSNDEKREYWSLLKGFLAWDLAYQMHFDGDLAGWGLLSCGVFPKEFEKFKFLADDIAIFAQAYVNYYMARVK